VREIRIKAGSLSEGETVKIMTKTSSETCSQRRREILGCSVIWEKNFELLRRDMSTGGPCL